MRWLPKSADPIQVQLLAAELRGNLSLEATDPRLASVLAHLLALRGITAENAARFLAPSLDHLHSPYAMTGMKAAVDRLEAAIEREEEILIYGDYDVDGTMAIVILKTAIELCGGTASFHVPHRIRDGYGMRDDVIERAAASGVRLIISVDTGIRESAVAANARQLGLDLIITDHHLPGQDGVPDAFAVVNPNQPGCEYPCKALCGAGVAFKLAQGLMERKLDPRDQARFLKSFLKVVAIATIADAVPLTGENRLFAKLGLEGLRSPVNPGLKALLEVSQLAVSRPLTSGEIAFRIAPRLNAAGRMDVARDVIELFSVKDVARARELASRLDVLNGQRQEEERRILKEIESRLESDLALRESFCMVVDGDGWHRGVIGITATRVLKRYCRPTVVISRDGEEAHGSGRSIRAFHLLNAIESCSELFTRYGGHAHACGFSLPAAQVPELRTRLDQYARQHLTLADFEPVLDTDAELPLDQITPALFQALCRLEPFGMGNPEPVFSAPSVRMTAPPRLIKDKHVKLKLAASATGENTAEAILTTPRCHPDSASFRRAEVRSAQNHRESGTGKWRQAITFDALGWHMAERVQQAQLLAGDRLDIAFTVNHNDHPEYGGLELSLCDFKTQKQTNEDEETKLKLASGSNP